MSSQRVLTDTSLPIGRALRLNVLAGLAIAFCVLGGCSSSPQGSTGSAGFKAVPGAGAPSLSSDASKAANQSFTLSDNSSGHMTDYLGKVVVVDFWATYCEPCTREAPQLDSLQKQFGADGLRVVGLNVGGDEDKPKIPEFAKNHSMGYTLGYPSPEMARLYLADDESIPQTFVFDRRGKLVRHFVGFNDDVEKGLREVIAASVASTDN